LVLLFVTILLKLKKEKADFLSSAQQLRGDGVATRGAWSHLLMRGSDASGRCSSLWFSFWPSKVWLHVLACAAGSDVVRFGMTCQAASLLAADASLWRTLCLRQKQHQRYAPHAEALPPFIYLFIYLKYTLFK
jgi:hypothetical protein